MPNYGWAGPGEMRELGLQRAEKPTIEKPSSPQTTPQERRKLFVCEVGDCDRRFPKAMIAARHFNSTHSDLFEDSDSWREHIQEIWQ